MILYIANAYFHGNSIVCYNFAIKSENDLTNLYLLHNAVKYIKRARRTHFRIPVFVRLTYRRPMKTVYERCHSEIRNRKLCSSLLFIYTNCEKLESYFCESSELDTF